MAFPIVPIIAALPSVLKFVGKFINPKVKTAVTSVPQGRKRPVTVISDKPWYRSRAMVSAVVITVAGVVSVFTDYDFSAGHVDQLIDNVDGVLMVLAGIGAGIGRAKAVK